MILLAMLIAWIAVALWHSTHRLPPGLHIGGSWQPLPTAQVRFVRDLSAADAAGAPLRERQIDALLQSAIAQAREIIVLDTGIFGDLPAAGPRASRLRVAPTVAADLAENLIRAHQQQPDLQILLLIDPDSTQFATATGPIERLRAAGINVVTVDVARLRSADAPFVSFWQLCCRWWARADGAGDWPNPIGLGPSGVTLGLWGRTAPYQRSHRQMLIADDGAGSLRGIVFSRPVNAESALHSACALQIAGAALEPALESEFVVAQMSGWNGAGVMQARSQHLTGHQRSPVLNTSAQLTARARIASEQGLDDTLVSQIEAAKAHDTIDIAALYLSDRELIHALLEAARRGVSIRLLLDPNKDGYGYERAGLPNRVVASELVSDSDGAVRVRWYRTHGEQFSAGFMLIRAADHTSLFVGTSELTRRDLNDFNLAAGYLVELPATASAATDAETWFDTLWFNRAPGGTEYTSDADVYADASEVRYWQYRLLEAAGGAFD
ncbi:MAG TPA: phospholipase D-like domain-containing protein [Steroidobacteraceae bacterium]|nr:phospholipase D-like domain-containing protein [Steroidobacteraceae bacterium]